jgi:hypothetical protein
MPASSCGVSRHAGAPFRLPAFLYDEEAAKIREANNAHLGEGVGAYKA